MGEYNLGKLYGIGVYVELEESDERERVNLQDLRQSIKNEIDEIRGDRANKPMLNWINPNKFLIDREQYQRLLRLRGSILKNRSVDDDKYLGYLIQPLNIDDLKSICREYKIKNYSKYNKGELIEHIVLNIPEEMKFEFIEDNELDIISRQFALGLKIINNKSMEKIENIKVNIESHEVEILFSSKNWKSKSYISITDANIGDCERICECKMGDNGGLCPHFWIGFTKSYKLGFFSLADWRFSVIPLSFKEIVEKIKI